MFNSDRPYTFDKVVRMLLGAGLFIGLVWLLGFLSSVLVPFVTALILAYLLNPFTTLVERKLGSRGLAVAVTVIGLLAAVSGVFLILVPMVAAEFTQMGQALRALATNAELAARAREFLPPEALAWLRELAANQDFQTLFTADGVTAVAEKVFNTVMPGIKGALKGAANVLGALLGLGIILLYFIFLLADFGRIKRNWRDYLPPKYRTDISEFIDELEDTMSRYFRGQITIALLVGVLLSIGFALIGLPLAIVLGMVVGILNIAPYLGTLGLVPGVLLAVIGGLEPGQSPWVMLGLTLLVFTVVQIIQEVVLIPKIQGKSLGLSPWLIVLALSIWGKLLGFLGLLIALPTTCICLSYYHRMLAAREAAAADGEG